MRSLFITAFDSGILTWNDVGDGNFFRGANSPADPSGLMAEGDRTQFILSVNGKNIHGEGVHRGNSADTSAWPSADIEIAAAENGRRAKDCAALAVRLDKTDNSLSMLPARGLTVRGETLYWQASGGAPSYRVVDLDFNVVTVSGERTSYDMSGKNLIYGVYPDGAGIVGRAEISPTPIKYLEGEGTADSPYLIKTPFDLRAIDYYEQLYAEGVIPARNHYKIVNDIDYNAVRALESDSNVFTLRKPFFGRLDGNGKRLSNLRVNYDGGFWALFDFLAKGSAVENLIFDNPVIVNRLQDKNRPVNASVATVCDRNYGTIDSIKVTNADYTAAGGEVCGIALHNYGVVARCSVSGVFKQESTLLVSQACYEMAGLVLENCAGGTVKNCVATTLTVIGAQCEGDCGNEYNNVRTAAGIVAVNRAGGTVKNCAFTAVAMTRMLDFYDGERGGYEWGGVVAYNAGTVCCCDPGSMRWGAGITATERITQSVGSGNDLRGRLVGKNDGAVDVSQTTGDGHGF